MKKPNFLARLNKAGNLVLVDTSEEISASYLSKSEKCTIVAKLAFNAGIYENAVTEAYYSLYNCVMALFFKCGIKCENHSAAVFLIRDVFDLKPQYAIFSEFKRDRIDNQYYVPAEKNEPVTKEKCSLLIKTSQKFNNGLRAYMESLNLEEIKNIRKKFNELNKKEWRQ